MMTARTLNECARLKRLISEHRQKADTFSGMAELETQPREKRRLTMRANHYYRQSGEFTKQLLTLTKNQTLQTP